METVYDFVIQLIIMLWILIGIIGLISLEIRLIKRDDYVEIKKMRLERRKIENDYLVTRRTLRNEYWLKIFKRKTK